MTKTVLFLCTGNSARSQMAEGLVASELAGEWRAHSAGTQPAGYVHPLAVEAMAEIGIDISGQRSKGVQEFRDAPLDLVVTVCDDANESCPLWLGPGRRVHVGFQDPARAEGTRQERLQVFREVRDQIRSALPGMLAKGG